MKLASVEIESYRAIDRLDLPLDPQMTVLFGPNGCGKTSVLTAIAMALGVGAESDYQRSHGSDVGRSRTRSSSSPPTAPQVLTTVHPKHIVELAIEDGRVVAGAPPISTYGAEAGYVLSGLMGVEQRPDNEFTRLLAQYMRLIADDRGETDEAFRRSIRTSRRDPATARSSETGPGRGCRGEMECASPRSAGSRPSFPARHAQAIDRSTVQDAAPDAGASSATASPDEACARRASRASARRSRWRRVAERPVNVSSRLPWARLST